VRGRCKPWIRYVCQLEIHTGVFLAARPPTPGEIYPPSLRQARSTFSHPSIPSSAIPVFRIPRFCFAAARQSLIKFNNFCATFARPPKPRLPLSVLRPLLPFARSPNSCYSISHCPRVYLRSAIVPSPLSASGVVSVSRYKLTSLLLSLSFSLRRARDEATEYRRFMTATCQTC